MKLNLYNHLKLATEISELMDTNKTTDLERRSLDAILDLLSIVRQLQEENNVKPTTVNSNSSNSDLFGSTLGYGRDSYK